MAVLTVKIKGIQQHLIKGHKDHQARRHLNDLVHKRRKLLTHLRKNNPEKYWKVIQGCGLTHDPQNIVGAKLFNRGLIFTNMDLKKSWKLFPDKSKKLEKPMVVP